MIEVSLSAGMIVADPGDAGLAATLPVARYLGLPIVQPMHSLVAKVRILVPDYPDPQREDAHEEMGLAIDRLENVTTSLVNLKTLSSDLHVKALRQSLPKIVADLKAALAHSGHDAPPAP